jgi:serine/threonine protein kinase
MSLQDSGKVTSLRDSGASDYGDFVGVREAFELEEYTEGPERYSNGLYYPICIGDVLVQKYRIEHKLGHGNYSTVWLAHDILKEKDVALKIMVSGNAGEDEYDMQKEIIGTVQDTSNILTCLRSFSLPGYKGNNHRVLVFDVRGPSLCSCLPEMSVATRMSAAKQLLKAFGEPTQRRNCAPRSELRERYVGYGPPRQS